jgi:insecticidal toxin complex protein TccC
VEIRSHGGTGEILHVITASAGSNSVQVLHWATKPPEDITNDQVRYSLNDHLKSSTLELDRNADLISQEWYYPYGGTACFAARSATEAKYKTVRYSGKERDATGLYYYGFRYYAPWLQRWINPDPAGYVDGMNLFRMVRNNPMTLHDLDGLSPEGDLAKKIIHHTEFGDQYYDNPELAMSNMLDKLLDENYHPNTIQLAMQRANKHFYALKKQGEEERRKYEEEAKNQKKTASPSRKKIPKPTKEYNIKTFIALYTTTHGSTKINNAMRNGEEIEITSRAVIRELEVRHDKIFQGPEGKKIKQDIDIAGGLFKLDEAKNVSHQLYLQRTESKTTYYRGARLTKSALKQYKTAKESGTALHSLSFLSVAKDKATAESFRTEEPSGLMIIKGFSAAYLGGGLSASAVKGSVFTFHADFKVTEVDELNNTVHLTELRGYTGPRIPLPY